MTWKILGQNNDIVEKGKFQVRHYIKSKDHGISGEYENGLVDGKYVLDQFVLNHYLQFDLHPKKINGWDSCEFLIKEEETIKHDLQILVDDEIIIQMFDMIREQGLSLLVLFVFVIIAVALSAVILVYVISGSKV